MNISDYITDIYVERNNNASHNLYGHANGFKPPYVSYSGFVYTIFAKCFAIHITDTDITSFTVTLRNDVFPNNIRPQQSGIFRIHPHYPNQFLQSHAFSRGSWPKRENNKTFYMNFRLQGMEVVMRRHKHGDNCIENWKKYDQIVLKKHLSNVGCRAPYHSSSLGLPVCNSSDQMKQTVLAMGTGAINDYPLPCRGPEQIGSLYYDSELRNLTCEQRWENNCFGNTSIRLDMLNPRFKLIQQSKAIGVQDLIGNCGGYLGLFLGYALMQLPELLSLAVSKFRKVVGEERKQPINNESKTSIQDRMICEREGVEINIQHDTIQQSNEAQCNCNDNSSQPDVTQLVDELRTEMEEKLKRICDCLSDRKDKDPQFARNIGSSTAE